MQQTKAGVVAALVAVSGAASAQEAVEWRVEDGGNGHWYACTSQEGTLEQSRDWALAEGGRLVSVTSAEENAVVASLMSATVSCWIGARKLTGLPWTWADGTPWSFTHWCPGEPCCGDGGLFVFMHPGGCWDDHNQEETLRRGVVEFTSDCNADGIVDFGQIRAGDLEDLNGNNIPDCCEDGSSCAPCVADVIEDGDVNGVDLAAVINAWGTDGGKLPRTDIDRNGIIDGADLAILLSAWGACD